MIGPLAITMAFALAVWIPLSLLHASGEMGALGFAAIMIVVAIMANRANDRWPESNPRR